MNKREWLKEQDYVDNMTSTSKNIYYLWMLKFKSQRFICGNYEGLFRFNFKNPLMWLLMTIVFISFLIGSMYDAIGQSVKELRSLISEGVTVEMDMDYKSENETK